MIELTFLRESVLINQVHEKSVIIVTICIVLHKWITFRANVCNGYHYILMIAISLKDIAISNIHGADYHCFINGINTKEKKLLSHTK